MTIRHAIHNESHNVDIRSSEHASTGFSASDKRYTHGHMHRVLLCGTNFVPISLQTCLKPRATFQAVDHAQRADMTARSTERFARPDMQR